MLTVAIIVLIILFFLFLYRCYFSNQTNFNEVKKNLEKEHTLVEPKNEETFVSPMKSQFSASKSWNMNANGTPLAIHSTIQLA